MTGDYPGNPVFGDWQGAPAGEAPEAETPVGEPCQYCEKPIVDGDVGQMMPSGLGRGLWEWRPIHRDCLLEWVLGPGWRERLGEP